MDGTGDKRQTAGEAAALFCGGRGGQISKQKRLPSSDTLCTTLQDGPYALLSRTEQGFRLMNKPIVLDIHMPCIEPGNVPILYGDFSRVQITDQGTGKLQARKDPAHPGMEECSMNAYMDVRLMDRQAVKGVQIKA